MGNLFAVNSPLWNLTNRVLQLLWLSLLWFACSLPIVTIGAATTALYSVMLQCVKNEEGYVTKQFFKAFKADFKQATALWALLFLTGVLLFLDLAVYFRSGQTGPAAFLLMVLFFSAFVVFLFICTYAYAILAKFNNTTLGTLRNALIMSVCSWPSSLVMLMAAVAVIALGSLVFPPLLLCAPALTAFINCRFLTRIFGKYIRTDG